MAKFRMYLCTAVLLARFVPVIMTTRRLPTMPMEQMIALKMRRMVSTNFGSSSSLSKVKGETFGISVELFIVWVESYFSGRTALPTSERILVW